MDDSQTGALPRADPVANAAAVACGLLVGAWPFMAGLRAANDDVKWVRTPDHDLPLLDSIAVAWRSEASFRPLEVLVAHFADAITLTCWLAAVVQAAGLVATLLGVVRLCAKCFPGSRPAALGAITFMALSPATTCSVWQVDSCSQTWTAALGVWATLECWRGLERAAAGAIPWRTAGVLGLIFAVGCSVKETFYGWSAGLGIACIVATIVLLARGRRAAARASLVMVPVIVLPMAHLAVRFAFGALSQRLAGEEGSRYQFELGLNVLINGALSLAGIAGTGPFHLATDDHAAPWLRFAPYASVAAAAFAAVGVAMLELMSGGAGLRALRWKPLAFAGVAAIGSLTATLPMGSVSELYGMGANAWAAVVVAGAIAMLWNRGAPDEQAIGRAIASACVLAIVSVGTYGVASRALHFRAVWVATAKVNTEVLEFQSRLAPSADPANVPAGVVYFPMRCMAVRTYGQYVMPVAQAINVEWTGRWLARRDPTRMIAFAIGKSPAAPSPSDLVIDCGTLPDHGHW
jgi:hypothetical protein